MPNKNASYKPGVTGLILAGGAGRRAGGRDKGLIVWNGRPLIAHVYDRVNPQVNQLIISCNRNADSYSAVAPALISDLRPGYEGPLAGIEAAASSVEHDFLLVVPCDAPLIPRDLLAQLMAAISHHDDAEVVYARHEERNQYLCALLRSTCLNSLPDYLDSGERAVRHWYSQCGAIAVDMNAEPSAFLNINNPES